MLLGDTLYHFDAPPSRAGGKLAWAQNFGHRQIAVTADCPPPPKGSGPLGS